MLVDVGDLWDLGPVSGKILSLETYLSSLITMATIVFSMLKFISGLKIFLETGPCYQQKPTLNHIHLY